MGSCSSRRCVLVGVVVALLEEFCHCGRGLYDTWNPVFSLLPSEQDAELSATSVP